MMASKKKSISCAQCNKKIFDKHYLTCSLCKQPYDLSCTNKEKLFYLMDKDSRAKWECIKCKQTQKQKNKSSTPLKHNTEVSTSSTSNKSNQNRSLIKETAPVSAEPSLKVKAQQCTEPENHNTLISNVTTRRYNVPIQNSFDSLSEEDDYDGYSLRNNTLNRSCPELYTNYKVELEEIKNKMSNLQEKLEIADNEIANLLSENTGLKKLISNYEMKIKHLQEVCISPRPKEKRKADKTKPYHSQIEDKPKL